MTTLRLRLLTSAALLTALLLISLAPPALRLAAIGALLLYCWREWLRLAGITKLSLWLMALGAAVLATPLLWSIFMPAGALLGPPVWAPAFPWLLAASVAGWCLALGALRQRLASLGKRAAALCGLAALLPAWLVTLALHAVGRWDLLLLLYGIVAAADTGA